MCMVNSHSAQDAGRERCGVRGCGSAGVWCQIKFQVSGFRFHCAECRVQGSRRMVQSAGCRVQGAGWSSVGCWVEKAQRAGLWGA